MASFLFSPFKSRFLLASTVLLLFIPPILSLLVFFWPLIVSTVLGVLAFVSFGQHGISTAQEDEISVNRAANPDMVVSSTANMEEISDVLMVGNQEVTWLEWLHNEDMEKCRAQERANCMSAGWNLEEFNVTCEASLGTVASRVEEKSMVDAYATIYADESSANEQVASAADASSITVPHNGICERTQVDKKLYGLVSPVLDVSGADAIRLLNEDVDVVKTNVLSFKGDDATRDRVLADVVVNLTQKDGDLLVAEGALKINATTMVVSDGIESRFAARDEVETSVDGRALAVQGERVAYAFPYEVRDVTTTPRGGLKLALENEASECSCVDAGGECILISPTSKVMRTADASKVSFEKEGSSLMLESESLPGQELGRIHEEDAEKRDCK